MKVIIDTSGLLVPAEWGVDIFEELYALGFREYVVPSAVMDELDMLARKNRKRSVAGVAKALLGRCEVVEAPGSADEVIEKLALEMGSAVFTNDAELRRKLKKIGVKTVFLRARHRLDME